MRPLFHPSVENITVEAILHALSDPVRLAILGKIVAQESSSTCMTLLNISDRTIPKSTLSLQLKVLREAGLIHGERRGVEMYNTSRIPEIDKRFPGLVASIINAYDMQIREERQVRKTNDAKRKMK